MANRSLRPALTVVGTTVASVLTLTLAGPAAAAPVAPLVAPRVAEADKAATAAGFTMYKFPVGQAGTGVTCTGVGLNVSSAPDYSRDDCGFANFLLSGDADQVQVQLLEAGADQPFATLPASVSDEATGEHQVDLLPTDDWPAGTIRMVVLADGEPAGESTFGHNRLVATVGTTESGYQPGDAVTVEGTIAQADSTANSPETRPVGATFGLELRQPDGTGDPVPGGRITAADDGTFTATIPGELTRDVQAGPESDYTVSLSVAVVDAEYDDPRTGAWAADDAGAGPLVLTTPPDTLLLENSFVSAVGWVKPGDTYPSRVFVRNPTDRTFHDVSVTVEAAQGATFTQSTGGSTIVDSGKAVTWPVGTVEPGATETLVLESQADTTEEDPQIVWKDISSTATLTIGGAEKSTQLSHGPKVIPPGTTYETARYGDRPFPVVPVDYRDRKHQETNSGDELSGKINSRTVEGSTYNLFQEMSLGQLFPEGTIPSTGIATAEFGDEEYDFTTPQPQGTCKGLSLPQANGTPLNPSRIVDGFYQLPGDTEYYGGDRYGSAVVGSAGVAPLFDIDSACGPTGKLVYDAATIADPEIDYSDYDTDKDGVVDFFMVVFAGCGGNGASQLGPLGCPYDQVPYDNIWPHSSSLEFYYTDEETGLAGYVTNDQLKDLEGRPLYYADAERTEMTTTKTEFPVFVRVGPYNVNPETAIDKASVISHEYGHSLGLPDFYSSAPRETYGDWNLMATDKSQHMDIFSRQEMGWVVPDVLQPGEKTVRNWQDSKTDTGRISWKTPDGEPYTLVHGEDGVVHNSQAYVAKLPGRQLIDPAKFDTGDKASKTHAWWSGSGNDFGCSPEGGHNLDVVVPGVADLPEGTTIQLDFKSLWDIEWDYDYGFVLTSTPTSEGGPSGEYTSNESENGYTTPATQNPNGNACQLKYGNGITGSSGSYDNGTAAVDRVTGDIPESVFLADSYDVSELVGQDLGVVRFSYATDPGLARPGWFIDDLKITATLPDGSTETLLETDLEDADEGGPEAPSFFSGGCKDDTAVAQRCTDGWNYIASDAEAPADHAYYLELRDRSGFDLDGNGEIDRDPIGFAPGLSLVYTDEAHGYGNTGGGNPPAQSPLDSQPEPGNDTPNLSDAAWTDAAGDKSFSDSGKGHVDNYTDPDETQAEGDVANPWRFDFDCLSFVVDRMVGETNGPEKATPGDLAGDVTFDIGGGCGEFDYGYVTDGGEAPGNTDPVAVAKTGRKSVELGKAHRFDGTRSSDAETPDDLDYSWDFGDGGVKKDAVGPQVKHEFSDPGVYKVELTVTDPRGRTDTDVVTVRVFKNLQCGKQKVTRTGGWASRHGSGGDGNHHCDNGPGGTGGDTMSLDFRGSRIGVKWGRAQQGGSAQVLVDGERVGSISFQGRSAEPRFDRLRVFKGFGGGRHTIELVVDPPEGDRRLAYVDYFRVYGTAYKTQ